ncbi:MAG: O-antigen ligase family protein, partial [Pseudomonadota bacterium]
MTGTATHSPGHQRLYDAATVLLLAVFPAGHILATRILPATLLVVLILLGAALVANAATRDIFIVPRRSSDANALLVSGSATVVFVLGSALWAPDPTDAFREAGMLLALPLVAWALALGLSKANLARPVTLLVFGLAVCALTILLDMFRVTELHSTFSDSAELYDLNRVTVWLALVAPLLIPAILAGQVKAIVGWPIVLLTAVAVGSGEGQAAQLAWLAATVAVIAVLVWRKFVWLIFGGAALALLVFPFAATALIGTLDGSSSDFMEAAHAAHRLTIWNAYAADIAAVPLWGFGANADALLGAPDSAVGKALAAAGYEGQVTSPHTVLLEWYINFGAIGTVL